MLGTKMSRAVLALVSLAAFSLTGVSSASAVACTYNNCNGMDPQAAGCSSGSTTLKNFTTAKGVYVELRYSSTCHSTWTRISASCTPGQKPYLETGYIDYYGTYHRQNIYVGPGQTQFGCTGHDNPPREVVWTPMSSFHRERLTYGVDDYGTRHAYTTITTCNDCL
ncbi:DUF2690 domain-containing protein [Kribbella sp. NPDC004875]|uniref:DUF2690 domain-containing protein n=1 Tax=Kribbella sp. NPDC004875 TaxID=3364107 RepID=UPI0036D027F0